ncbi:unnamed protein product [Wuchereria bancrofti]|uniref:BTB domain-containing protein n=1 Tax=Wuchereria bancrofti TaxID=6293 RepID=A0A3P7FCW5_WUCBA|nr:unnamed protein product [Wuchereria bancrofti]
MPKSFRPEPWAYSKSKEKVPRGSVGNNSPNNQKPPPAPNVRLTLKLKINILLLIIKIPRGAGYICCNLVNRLILQELIESHEFIILHISININKNYFNIEELIKSPAISSIEISMNPENYDLLETVLACEPRSSANNDATSYHVHQKSILKKKCSLPSDQLLVVDAEDRIIFPYLTGDDMKYLLIYLYTGKAILPKFDAFARVGRVVSLLVDREQLISIFMQWQKLIVKNLLQIEKKNNNELITEESLKALISVFSAPYGALPYAKRMALSLLADQITKNNETLAGKYNGQLQYSRYQVGHFMELKRVITSVKKTPDPL